VTALSRPWMMASKVSRSARVTGVSGVSSVGMGWVSLVVAGYDTGVASGGKTTKENLRALCARRNVGRGNRYEA